MFFPEVQQKHAQGKISQGGAFVGNRFTPCPNESYFDAFHAAAAVGVGVIVATAAGVAAGGAWMGAAGGGCTAGGV